MAVNLFMMLVRVCLALIAAPWALAVSAFIFVACLLAQIFAILANVLVFAFTWRWPRSDNLMTRVACPRIGDLWADWASLWKPVKAAPEKSTLSALD